jgi:hypothetical protein
MTLKKTRRTFRPMLEALEDRLVPTTTYTWTGTNSSDWTDPGNWTSALGTAYPNGATDEAKFTGGGAHTAIYEDGAGTVSGTLGELTVGGADIISLRHDVTITQRFTMSAGTINFDDCAYTLKINTGSILNNNNWTGGTIGQNDASATLQVTGSSVLDVQNTDGTPDLAVPLFIDGGTSELLSAVRILGTSLAMPTSSVVTITLDSANSKLIFSGVPSTGVYTVGPTDQTSGDYVDVVNGTVVFSFRNCDYQLNLPVYNDNGVFQVNEGATVEIAYKDSHTNNVSYYQPNTNANNPEFYLGTAAQTGNPAKITLDEGADFSAGTFYVYGSGGSAQNEIYGGTTAITDVSWDGCTVDFDQSNTQLYVGGYKLNIAGATTVNMTINHGSATSPSIEVAVVVAIAGGDNTTLDISTTGTCTPPKTWTKLIYSDTAGDATGNFRNLTVPAGTNWSLTLDGTNTQWDLKRTS